jgi:hypothetical protein
LVCPGLPESDRVGSSSVTKCLETRHFVRFSGHVVTLLDPPFSEFDSRRLHHGTAENRGPVALRGAWQARDKARRGEDEPRITTRERPPPRDTTDPIIPAGSPVSATALARNVDGADLPLPNVLSAKHLDRIAGGLLYAATSRAPWATLLARTFEVDGKACARCTGRLEVRAVVTDLEVARRILDAMPRAARAPPLLDSTLAYEPLFA